MTERFTNDGKLIMQNGEVWTVAHTRIDADVIAESLNILIKKNEQLEREYNKLKHRHSLLHDECLTVEHAKEGLEKDVLALERENAQLIQENEKLSTNMEMEDYLARLEEENINLQIKLQKIRDYAKDGEVKQGIIEKVILND